MAQQTQETSNEDLFRIKPARVAAPGPARNGRESFSFIRAMTRTIGRGHRKVFLLSMCFCLLSGVLLFMQRQSAGIYRMLKDDFRIVLIIDDKASITSIKEAEDRLKALPGVSSVDFLSKDAGLAFLRQRDPGLVRSVAIIGENPLPELFEVRLDDSVLGDAGAWLEANVLNGKMPVVAGASYKPEQIYAIMQAGFYNRLLTLSLSLVFVVFVLYAFFAEWRALADAISRPRPLAFGWVLSGMAGAVAALGICWGLVAPVKYLSPMWWSYPSPAALTGLVLCGGLLGWTLYRWKQSSY